MSESCGGLAALFRQVLFSSHLLCFQLFLFSPLNSTSNGRVETIRLTHAVKNGSASRFFWRFGRCLSPFGGGQSRRRGMMSKRFAVALEAIIGATVLGTTAAQARGELVGVHGDYSPGTIVIKTNERHLYFILDSGHAMRYPV